LNKYLTSDDRMIKESAEWVKLVINRAISVWGSSQLSISFVVNCLHAFGCVGVGSGIAWVKLSPSSVMGLHMSNCLHCQTIEGICLKVFKVSLTLASSPMHRWPLH
jgi:hypothetical protein